MDDLQHQKNQIDEDSRKAKEQLDWDATKAKQDLADQESQRITKEAEDKVAQIQNDATS